MPNNNNIHIEIVWNPSGSCRTRTNEWKYVRVVSSLEKERRKENIQMPHIFGCETFRAQLHPPPKTGEKQKKHSSHNAEWCVRCKQLTLFIILLSLGCFIVFLQRCYNDRATGVTFIIIYHNYSLSSPFRVFRYFHELFLPHENQFLLLYCCCNCNYS